MTAKRVLLGEVADFYAGSSLPEGEDWCSQEGGYLLARVSDMNRSGNEKYILTAQQWNSVPGQKSATCPGGAVVIPKRGGAIGTNKKRIVQRAAVLDPNLMAVRPHEDVLDLDYLYQWFLTVDLEQLASGSSVPQLNKKDLAPLSVPLPSLTEQQRIAAVLDQVDALRAKRREAIALLDDLTWSVFLDTFGDPASNPNGWRQCEFGEAILDGPQNGLYKPAGDYGGGVPILRIDSFRAGELKPYLQWRRVNASVLEQERYGLRKFDIVINRVNSRSHLGKCVIVGEVAEGAVFESNMMRVRVDPSIVRPTFIERYLQTRFARKQILESAKDAVNQSSVNQRDIRGLLVFVPPMNMQCKFEEFLEEIREHQRKHRAHLDVLDELFTSLRHRAFSGTLWDHETTGEAA
ncbi:restriction endonuclease subunit S [Streptomyces tendae]|uniref:restriction endonuclease subunit S n=1 Tax=Streptomyces tendae TaxID=1932 RepID=UPI0033A9FE1B